MGEALFDLATVEQDSPRLALLKKHDIQTHHAPHCQDPWLAIPMIAARKAAGEYASPGSDLVELCASAVILLEDAGLTFFGHSKREVEEAALEFAERGGQS